MNIFIKILLLLQSTMKRPVSYGWFHLLCIFITLTIVLLLYYSEKKNGHDKNKLKTILLIYGITALLLELLKQISWSFNYNGGNIYWDYQWYASPFQLCTMPAYCSIIAAFLKDSKIKKALLSFMAFFTILGSISTMIYPESCFTKDILINIHTMFLHCGSFIVSIYLFISKEVKINRKSFISGFKVFLICALVADILNITFFQTKIIGNETFNMFYISPYFISILPVFNIIQQKVPYLIYLLFYIFAFFMGGIIILLFSKLFSIVINKLKKKT